MKWNKTIYLVLFLSLLPTVVFSSPKVNFSYQEIGGIQEFSLDNQLIILSLWIKDGVILHQKIQAKKSWLASYNNSSSVSLRTDADFGLDFNWTGWKAPGKVNNAANPVRLTKSDFVFKQYRFHSLAGKKGLELELFFEGRGNPFEMKLVFRLEEDDFFLKRKIAVRDPSQKHHFLRWIWPVFGDVFGDLEVIKSGGFGQPAAFSLNDGGGFFGLEYPASENHLIQKSSKQSMLRCGQEIGQRVGNAWIESEWLVQALVPQKSVKQWFWAYLNKIRCAPLRPYLLYNSWYDLRSPEMVEDPERVMNEENVLKAILSFRKRLVEERGVYLDAFVLDDGWDIYRSDWQLNLEQFPGGLEPLVQELEKINCDLGIWFGPTGGYSHRDWRVEWMREKGYETVGDQMCLAGEKYFQLFKKRVNDLVSRDRAGYFKWDGIQFSCSEPGHGHLPDIYSRRAVMESVVELCSSVRSLNPDIFLNITSGTWLSPWWLKYADQIWMQGADYGYSDIPSISRRDRAMSYRDDVLFEDLRKEKFWFPLSNLMTHGIIKGHLNKLGGPQESLDKFADNALLYFARGITMWELYISPDFLTDEQWDILAQAVRWAEDKFSILCRTEMIGGDPGDRQPYGYAHFTGSRGIVACRNPFIEPQILRVKLSEDIGLSPKPEPLVVEQIYPVRWVYPDLVGFDSELEIPLSGYEMVVLEIYPLDEAVRPLLAGRLHQLVQIDEETFELISYPGEREALFLNEKSLKAVSIRGKEFDPAVIALPPVTAPARIDETEFKISSGKDECSVSLGFVLNEPVSEATLSLLIEPDENYQGKDLPGISFIVDGKEMIPEKESEKGKWSWNMVKVQPGVHLIECEIMSEIKGSGWEGSLSAWLLVKEKPDVVTLNVKWDGKTKKTIFPPLPWLKGELRWNYKLGERQIKFNP